MEETNAHPAGARPPGMLVGPYLQNPGTTTVAVLWIRSDGAGCRLRIEPEGGPETVMDAPPARAVDGRPDRVYEVRLEGLRPGTGYRYEVLCPDGRCAGRFRTLPEQPEEFTFIYYGDNKGGHEVHRRVASRFERHAPLFVMHSGDMTDHGKYEEYAPLFFEPIREVIDHLPLVVSRGNHEGDGKAYRLVFSLPEGDTWHSFDCGPAHFIVLDTTGWRHEWERDDVRRMYEWLERDLDAARGAAWKIVMHHEPSYDLGWRKDDWGRQDFLPLLRRGGADLTLSGHAHGYQRLRPMVARGENEGHPITHVISAGAGANIGGKPLDESDFLAAQARRFNYMPISVSAERLLARVLSEDDEPLDEFELVKRAGQYDQAVLRQALWAGDYGKPGKLRGPYAQQAGGKRPAGAGEQVNG